MNIIQIHERVRFWLDTVGSARFEPFDIDNALNSAMNDIVEQKYQGTRALTAGNSFQRTQKLRDELSNIVYLASLNVSNQTKYSLVAAADIPAGYKYLLCAAIVTAAREYPCWPLTYDQHNSIQDNPYRRTRQVPFAKQYYIESSEGIRIYHSLTATPTGAKLYYLKEATQWKYGIDYTSSKSFSIGNIIIANSDVVVYNGNNYLRGDAITIVTGHLNITSGTANYDYVSSNININLHEEIARKAAINALISIEQFDKSKALIEHFV